MALGCKSLITHVIPRAQIKGLASKETEVPQQ